MPNPFDLNQTFQTGLKAQDAATLAALKDAYAPVLLQFKTDLAAVLADFDAKNPGQAYRLRHLLDLADGLQGEIDRYNLMAGPLITAAQKEAISQAAQHVPALVEAALGTPPAGVSLTALMTAYDPGAVAAWIGMSGDGSPIAQLLADNAKTTVQDLRNRITEAVAMGMSSDALAAELAPALEGGMLRAQRVARTETLRAYRQSAQATMEANTDVINGWYWHASESVRTCPVCWAEHGTWHPLMEPFASHVSCRCSAVPAVKSWADMGYPGHTEHPLAPVSGEAEFAKLPAAQQRKILGPGRHDLYTSGKIALQDAVQTGTDPVWGAYRQTRSLSGCHAAAEARAAGAYPVAWTGRLEDWQTFQTQVQASVKALLSIPNHQALDNLAGEWGDRMRLHRAALKNALQDASLGDLKLMAYNAGIKYTNYASKADLVTVMGETKAATLEKAKAALKAKYDAAQAVKAANKAAKEAAAKAAAEAAAKAAHEAMPLKDLKALAYNAGHKYTQYASKDELVALLVSSDTAVLDAVKAAMKAKSDAAYVAKAANKAAKKAAAQQIPPTPVTPPVTPSVAQATQQAQAAQAMAQAGVHAPPPLPNFQAVDDAWTATVNGAWTAEGRANVGGMHEKFFYTGPDGQRYMFKPAQAGYEWVSHAEEAAYKIARLADPQAIEVRVMTLDGRVGTVQRWRTDLAAPFDFAGVAPEALTPLEVAQLQREQVIDWLIGNHDAHSKQFLRGVDGHVWGVDKGQAWKFFGKDKLDLDYIPNPEIPIYRDLFRAMQAGRVHLDPQETWRAIQALQRLSDEDLRRVLAVYAEGRYQAGAAREAFYQGVIARKNALKTDFEAFYARVLNQPGFAFADETAQTLEALARIPPTVTGRVTAEEVDIARAAGWQGRSLPIDAVDIEDHNVLLFTETHAGTERTVMRLKIRPESDAKIVKALQAGERVGAQAVAPAAPAIGKPLAEDMFYDDILKAVKTAKHHAGDGAYNTATLNAARAHRPALEQLALSTDAEVQAMAQHYLKWLNDVDMMVANQVDNGAVFARYVRQSLPPPPPAAPAVAPSTAPFRYSEGEGRFTLREVQDGRLVAQQDGVSISDSRFGQTGSVKADIEYAVEFPDGTRVHYRKWMAPNQESGQPNVFALRGDMEIVLEGPATVARVETMLDKLQALGIKADRATPVDEEILYLKKQAYVLKLDNQGSDFALLVESMGQRGLTPEEQVVELRTWWSKKLKVKDVTQLPHYNPAGEYSYSHLTGRQNAGWRLHYRFDISPEAVAAEWADHGFYNSITGYDPSTGNSNTVMSLVQRMLDNGNPALLSNREKIRSGVAASGASVSSDFRTGGANYVFTRFGTQSGRGAGMVWKPGIVRRMDAISYSGDNFGKVIGQHVRDNRRSTLKEIKSKCTGGSNETIFKHDLTLLDNIQYIVGGSDANRRAIIQAFKDKGITHLPDGRAIEDVVKGAMS